MTDIVAGAYVGFQVKSRRMFALCENHEFQRRTSHKYFRTSTTLLYLIVSQQ